MSKAPETKISTMAAQALWEKMRHYDKELDARVEDVNSAMVDMINAHTAAQELYVRRAEIAKELGRLAHEDFLPVTDTQAKTMPSHLRFWRANPLPTNGRPASMSDSFAAPYIGKRRHEDDLDDEL